MNHPLVSVVTCTYKKFNTIFSTIDSLLQQDYPNIEYIITDDGSDNFPYNEICEYIEKHRKNNLINYKIIQNKYNIGTVRNLNGGMKEAAGKYVMVLAGDDIYFSNQSISLVVARMEENRSNLLIASRLVCNESVEPLYLLPHYLCGQLLQKKDTEKKQHELFISGQHYIMASGSAMCYRKSFLESNGYFDERYFLLEDAPYVERYLRNYKMDMAYDIVLIKYQLGGVSTGSTIPPKLVEDMKLYDSSDRIMKINEVSKLCQKLILYNSFYDSKQIARVRRMGLIMKYPSILIYKIYYKLVCSIAELYDRKVIVPRLIKGKGENNAGC